MCFFQIKNYFEYLKFFCFSHIYIYGTGLQPPPLPPRDGDSS